VQDFTVTREELTMMPPYCTAIQGRAVGLPQPEDSPLRGTIPADCPALHHYCDGLKAMVRVDLNQKESKYWLSVAVQTFQNQVLDWEHRGLSCSLRPELYTNLGSSLFRQNKASAGLAVMNFNKTLELRKDFFPAYYGLSDVYLYLGKRKEALGVVEEGLKYVRNSKGLLRRFKELGGKTPPPPIAKPNPQQPTAAAGPGPEPSTSPSTTPNNKAAGEGAVAAPAAVEPEAPKIGSPTNPYCRFCPD
ncbi:MAG: tetratricopeptide repeat protein, partial [Thiobacillaceae bacterium]